MELSLATVLTDRTAGLFDGRVTSSRIGLTVVGGEPPVLMRRMLNDNEFDAAEMSLASYVLRYSRGSHDLVAIPVFPLRMFLHSAVYVRSDGRITNPSELNGRSIGIPRYQMTPGIWTRLLLAPYGFDFSTASWVTGGVDGPGVPDQIELRAGGVTVVGAPPGVTLDEMLQDGSIDAIFTPFEPRRFLAGDPSIRRLFPDSRSVEEESYRQTGIFPIIHTVVVARSLVERHPWLGGEITQLYERAKGLAMAALGSRAEHHITLPWLDEAVREQRAVMGGELWPYGLEANKVALEAFIEGCARQSLLGSAVRVDELFVSTP